MPPRHHSSARTSASAGAASREELNGWVEKVDQALSRSAVDAETRQRAAVERRTLQERIQQIRRGPHAIRDVLRARVRADRRARRPPCTCSLVACPLSRGELPPDVESASDVQAAIGEFAADHPGQPVSLYRGLRAWTRFVAETVSRLRQLFVYLDDEEASLPPAVTRRGPVTRRGAAPDGDTSTDGDRPVDAGEDGPATARDGPPPEEPTTGP